MLEKDKFYAFYAKPRPFIDAPRKDDVHISSREVHQTTGSVKICLLVSKAFSVQVREKSWDQGRMWTLVANLVPRVFLRTLGFTKVRSFVTRPLVKGTTTLGTRSPCSCPQKNI